MYATTSDQLQTTLIAQFTTVLTNLFTWAQEDTPLLLV